MKLTQKQLRVLVESTINEAAGKGDTTLEDVAQFMQAMKTATKLSKKLKGVFMKLEGKLENVDQGMVYDDVTGAVSALNEVEDVLSTLNVGNLRSVYANAMKAVKGKPAKKPVEKPYTGGRSWHGGRDAIGRISSRKSRESW